MTFRPAPSRFQVFDVVGQSPRTAIFKANREKEAPARDFDPSIIWHGHPGFDEIITVMEHWQGPSLDCCADQALMDGAWSKLVHPRVHPTARSALLAFEAKAA